MNLFAVTAIGWLACVAIVVGIFAHDSGWMRRPPDASPLSERVKHLLTDTPAPVEPSKYELLAKQKGRAG